MGAHQHHHLRAGRPGSASPVFVESGSVWRMAINAGRVGHYHNVISNEAQPD